MKTFEMMIKKAAEVILERAPRIEGISEHSLEVLRRLLARGGDLGTLFVEFRRGERGSAPGVELRIGVDCLAFHDEDVGPTISVNWSSAGSQSLAKSREFSSLFADVIFLADVLQEVIDEVEIPSKCQSCGGETDRDPSEDSVLYCTECGKEVIR